MPGLAPSPTREIDVLYFVEHRDRELETAALVARTLRSRYGLSVAVIPIEYKTYQALYRWKPNTVVAPFGISAETFPMSVYWRVYGGSIGYVNIACEQILSTFFAGPKAPNDSFAREFVTHCAWNDQFVDWLKQNGVLPERIATTGSPQHVLYRDRYAGLHRSKRELAADFGLDASQRWILLPLNYGGAFLPDELRKGMLHRGFDESDLESYIEYCRRSMDESVRWVAAAAETMPEMTFVFRPRPVETESSYLELLASTLGTIPSNVKVIKGLAVRDWIIASDMVISSHSTTLLDAAAAGRRVGMLHPFEMPDRLKHEWMDLIPRISSSQDLKDLIEEPDLNPPPEAVAFAEERFGLASGDAIDNLAAVISAEASRPRPGARPQLDLLQRARLRYVLMREVARRRLALAGLPIGPMKSWRHDWFRPEDITEIQRRVVPAEKV